MFLKPQNKFHSANFEDWADTIKQIFGGLEMSAPDPSKFEGTLNVYNMDEFDLVMVKSTPANIWHRGSIGDYSETERFLVKMQISGCSMIKYGSKNMKLAPGDFLICDNSRSYCLSFDEETEILSIPIPGHVLGRFHSRPSDLAFKLADRTLAINNVLSDYLQSLWASRYKSSAKIHAKRLITHYFDMLAMGFSGLDAASAHMSSTQHGHLERCKEYIEKNLLKENLSPSLISKELSISERYLFSIFSNAGLTVTGYIVSNRLDKAAQTLRSRRFEKLTVAEIAFDAGFKSAAHFSRAFKTRFNETPTQYRKQTYV